MRKFTQFVLITAAIMAAPSAFAEMKIAVLNYQMALLEYWMFFVTTSTRCARPSTLGTGTSCWAFSRAPG